MLNGRDDNAFTKGKKSMTGNLNLASSKVLSVKEMKVVSKKSGITINDIVMSSMSTALHEYFNLNEDQTELIQVLLPANIRFKFYEKIEDIKLENKFAGIPLKVPLVRKM